MKFLIVFVALFAVALALPAEVEIVRSDSEVLPESFKYDWETSDGSQAEASGQLKNVGSEDEAIVVKGSYRYVSPDGTPIQVTYTADETGFHPEGAHLPVAPVV